MFAFHLGEDRFRNNQIKSALYFGEYHVINHNYAWLVAQYSMLNYDGDCRSFYMAVPPWLTVDL
jgi:hypothetical protein